MRIALDATYSVAAEPSGIAVYSREILAGLPRLFPHDEYIPAYRWKEWRRNRFGGRPLLPAFRTFRADIFHGLNQRVDRRPCNRVVTTFHDLFVLTGNYSTREFRERFSKQARTAALNSDLIITVSQFTAAQVEELLTVPRARLRVVPHGAHRPALPRHQADPPFILCVGTIQARKNIGRLVQAFEAVPAPWRLVLAGALHGYGADHIQQLIRTSSVASRITMTGYLPSSQLAELYASADVFAFPSLDEGFGIPVIEAMANGIPVLTSNGSALKEIGEGIALLTNPLDVDAIAEGLRRLTSDSSLRENLSRAGRERSLHYTWEQAVQGTYAVYRELAT